MKRIPVTKLANGNYRVGNKIIYQDMDGNLIAQTELTAQEKEAFYNYLGKRKVTTITK